VHFALNIFVLIGLLIALAAGVILLIAALIGLKLWIWHVAKRRSDARYQRERFRSDGELFPPAGRGLCDRCGEAYEKVYYLPSGERLCPDDYRTLYGD
jgi:hypothetical protein